MPYLPGNKLSQDLLGIRPGKSWIPASAGMTEKKQTPFRTFREIRRRWGDGVLWERLNNDSLF